MTLMETTVKISDVKKVNLYFVKSHWEALLRESRETGVPVSRIVRKLVAQYLNQKKPKAIKR